ncbi:MAG TPA: BON domain-containing protein, partial [Acidobacteriota bacterium]|nr:BON domain-containing protein [Acidobacteriota bacterium]
VPPPQQRRPDAQPAPEDRMRERNVPEEQSRQPSQQSSMNDDASITRLIQQKISSISTLSDDNITVQTRNGEVVLRGTVNNPQNENRAVSIAQSVPGVKAVRSQIELKKKGNPPQPLKKNKDQQ